MSQPGFRILHDQGRQLCFVGLGSMSILVQKEFPGSTLISLEDLEKQSQSWFDSQQFIAVTSDVILKQKIVAQVIDRGGVFFSLVHELNRIAPSTKIGRGCYVDCYNQSLPNDDVEIGDHCLISSFIMLAHHVKIKDFCHVSAYCFLGNCELGQGTVVGASSRIVGKIHQTLEIADYCNILIGSTVTKSINTSGTYYHDRKSLSAGSLEHRTL
jgi:UDP-3-O-[3-hydroxymyristoyl] glucosamine N-acyltransferase